MLDVYPVYLNLGLETQCIWCIWTSQTRNTHSQAPRAAWHAPCTLATALQSTQPHSGAGAGAGAEAAIGSGSDELAGAAADAAAAPDERDARSGLGFAREAMQARARAPWRGLL